MRNWIFYIETTNLSKQLNMQFTRGSDKMLIAAVYLKMLYLFLISV